MVLLERFLPTGKLMVIQMNLDSFGKDICLYTVTFLNYEIYGSIINIVLSVLYALGQKILNARIL